MKAKTIEELRNKFFEECVSENTGGYKVINYAPHDLIEWIKENIIQPEPIVPDPKQVTEEMIKIIKDAWYNGLGSHHNSKTQKEYDIDFECFFDTIKDYIKIFKNES